MLQRRLAELEERLRELVRRQGAEADAVVALAEDAGLPNLEPGQVAVRRDTLAVQVDAEQEPPTQPLVTPLQRAVKAQAAAVLAMRDAQRPAVQLAQADAKTQLEEALRLIEKQQEQQQQEQQKKERNELAKLYNELAARQATLQTNVEPLTTVENIDRRQRAELRGLAAEQEAVRAAADELKPKVADTLIFKAGHEQIDTEAAAAAEALRNAKPDPQTLARQGRITTGLLAMAAALADDPQDPSDFAHQDDGGGGGGGAGGQPQEQPLVPPLAELKLLRQMQLDVMERTRAAEAGDGPAPDLAALGEQQRRLAELGRELIDAVQTTPPGNPQ